MKPIVAIVGRPNVGKSTLFNRISGTHKAIVEDTPGVTRDRLYEECDWAGRKFVLVDTGGIEFLGQSDPMLSLVKKQVSVAIDDADIIVFLTDFKTGVTMEDQEVASVLRKSGKKIVLAVNKVEDYSTPELLFEFYSLGLGNPVPVSASHGMNVGDLLDEVTSGFPEDIEDEDPDTIKFAVAGRPNVGKSSLVNSILGSERVIVSDIAGTTRDAIDSVFYDADQKYMIIDTAGMRKKKKIDDLTERYSVIRTLRAIDRSDVVVAVLDAREGVTEQDQRILGYIHEQGKGCVIAVNKWDLIEKDDKTLHRMEKELRKNLLFISYAPMIFISALTGKRVDKVIETVEYVAEKANHKIATSILNEVISDAVGMNPPPTDKGKRLKIFYAVQTGVQPPKFVLYVNNPDIVHFSYKRYLENSLRNSFGFEGTPIQIHFVGRNER